MSTLPAPQRNADGTLIEAGLICAFLAHGLTGRCVMCGQSTVRWWDLSRAAIPPVIDATGTPTDQLPLHAACVPTLIEQWAARLESEGCGVAAPETGAATRTTRAPVGAYARRGRAA